MKLEGIKGIGPKILKTLNSMDIYNTDDLINYYPYRYDIIKQSDLDNLEQGDNIITEGIIESNPNLFFYHQGNRMSFRIKSKNKLFNVVIFNRMFLKQNLNIGKEITVLGKFSHNKNTIVANDILFKKIGDETTIEPVYHLKKNISNKVLNNIIREALKISYDFKEYIPDYLVSKYHYLKKDFALNIIHNPSCEKYLNKALETLKYEELFLFASRINSFQRIRINTLGIERNVSYKFLEEIISSLPFSLTTDQLFSIQEIYNDMISNKQMNRLLQGDVGSGKTIIAYLALYINYLSKYQGVMMAPTSILAEQHYHNFMKLFDYIGIKVKILTGGMSKSIRQKILSDLKEGKIDICFGTHALFTEDVIYKNLGLVITDEQHRFGVKQRDMLKDKGRLVDILYLSATPIPRTYALTIYGDMEVSSIHTMPQGRIPVKTKIVSMDDIKEVLTFMYNEIIKNNKIYVVAPMVEDDLDKESVYSLKEKMEKAFSKVTKIGLLHGKMKASEKEKVLENFAKSDMNILVSTTVIEVGIDFKEATGIVIFDANSFGLATLHQLRGRVGRNDMQSYCYLIDEYNSKRLKILEETNDGFKISEQDFKNRGSGDLFGIRQSGDKNFKIASLIEDFDLFKKAKEDSLEFVEKYMDYPKYEMIKEKIEKREYNA